MHETLNEIFQLQRNLLEHMGDGLALFAHSSITLCLCNVMLAVRASQSILLQDGHVWDADNLEIK
jgi:hypothetical protein